jgi:hypothetical protein
MFTKNIGVILPNMEIGQLAYETLTQINTEIVEGSDLDYRIFFENISLQCVNPLCSVMNINEIWNYKGILISTTLENTLFSLQVKANVLRIFYIFDMEWLRNSKNYLFNLSILRSPNLLLISRGNDAAKELERYSNRHPNLIMSKLNFKDLVNVLTTRANSNQI